MNPKSPASDIRSQVDGFARSGCFWWALIIGNVLMLGGQPLVFLLSVVLVLGLHGLVWAIDSTPDDWGIRVIKFLARSFVWFLIFAGVATIVFSPLEMLTQGRASRDHDLLVFFVAAVLTAGLYLVWRRWRRAPNVVTVQPAIVEVVPQPEPRADSPIEAEKMDHAIAQRRREDARAQIELFFHSHAPELQNRYTKGMLDEYVQRYMTDTQPPEVVEERAERLLSVIRQHLNKVEPEKPPRDSLDTLLAAYADRVRRVHASDLDEKDKKNLIDQLEEDREKAIKKAIREGRM